MEQAIDPQAEKKGRDEWWVLCFALCFPTCITYVYFVLLADAAVAVQQLAAGGLKLFQFLIPAIWVCGVMREKVGWPLPTAKGLVPALAFGAFIGGVFALWHEPLLSSLGVWQIAEDAIHQKVDGLGFATPLSFGCLALFYTFAHSLLEEYYWRWFVFGRLQARTSLGAAILISSIGFAGHHVVVLAKFFGWFSLTTWLGSFAVAVGGAVWAWMLSRYERVFPIWMSHALVDAAIFYVGYRALFATP